MKTKAVFDIEADDLLQDVSVVHCITLKDLTTGKKYHYPPHRIKRGLRKLKRYDILIGHNIISYDLPVLKKLYNWTFEGTTTDTVLMSRILFKNRTVPDEMKQAYKDAKKPIPNQAHGLESWGWTLGMGKVEHEDWSVYSEDMKTRNVVDVELNELVYYKMLEESKKQRFPNKSWSTIFSVFRIIADQVENGWKVDREKAENCIEDLTNTIAELESDIQPQLPYKMEIYNSKVVKEIIKDERFGWREVGFKVGTDSTVLKKPFTMSGKPSANLLRWAEKTEAPEEWLFSVKGQFSRIHYKQIEVKSGGDIKDWLLEQGWLPSEWNTKFTEVGGRNTMVNMSPKLSEDDEYVGLKDNDVCIKLLKYNQAKHRLSTISGYILRIREDGRMESDVSGLADTYRMKHRGIANVPSGGSFYSKEMRELFTVEEGNVLVGCDAAACQDRWLVANARKYGIRDEVFEDMILSGDKSKGTDSHSRAMKAINVVMEEEGLPLIDRDTSKTFNFAYKFGAQHKKLGTIAGLVGNKAVELGAKIEKALDEVFTAQKFLHLELLKEWKTTAKEYNTYKWVEGKRKSVKAYKDGYLKGLDGRPVFIKKEKDLLVYKVQSDEAIMFQKALILFHDKCKEGGLVNQRDYWQLTLYHDEIQVETKPEFADQVGRYASESIAESAEFFGSLLPQEGEYEIGQNWHGTH